MKRKPTTAYVKALKQWESGLSHDSAGGWYPDALATLQALSTAYQVDLTRIVYAFAALSPQVDLTRNVESLLALVHGRPYRHCTTQANRDKAIRILAGNLAALKGPKVTAFANAILGTGELVLDVWAFRAAGVISANPSPRTRDAVVRAYIARARMHGLTLSHYQAGVWLAIRSTSGKGRSRALALVSHALAYLRTGVLA